MVKIFNIARIIEVVDLEKILTQGNTLLVQRYLTTFFIHQVMFVALEISHDPVDVLV